MSDFFSERWLSVFAFLSLFALAVVVYMGKSYENSLQALDSTTHALIAYKVSANGLAPVLPMQAFVTNHQPNPVFNDHPFTLFYLVGKVMHFFGPSAWSARFLPGLFSVGCVLALAYLGMLLYSFPVGLIAGLILLLSRDFILIGSRFHLDTAMTFFIILSFIAWVKNRPLLTGVFAGMGLWMKTPVALLIFPSAFFALLLTGRLNAKTFGKLVMSALTGLFVGSWIWLVTGYVGGWDLITDYFQRQVWGTAVGGRGGGQGVDYAFGFNLLRSTYRPWILFLILSLVLIFFRKRWKDPRVALTLSAALVLEGVMGAVHFKFYWYFIPVFPFLALLCVDPFRDWITRKQQAVQVFFVLAGVLVPTILVATPIVLGPENFPAFRRFEPIIQNYGTCSDKIMFIDGQQPWGGMMDNIYELSFYTNRKLLEAKCDDAMQIAMSESPEWVIVSGTNLESCLSQKMLDSFTVQYRFGRQYLLSRIIPSKDALNLTPLARELSPPNGCTPVPYPQDVYFPAE